MADINADYDEREEVDRKTAANSNNNNNNSNNNTTTTATKKKLEMKIKKWHAIAEWTWGAEDDVCGICHSKFDQCAPDCKFPGDDSPVVWGTCSHAFHLKCIQKWLDNGSMSAHDQHVAQAEQKCPICRGDWSFKQA
jgi:anaphase-promoting complex subunit 11